MKLKYALAACGAAAVFAGTVQAGSLNSGPYVGVNVGYRFDKTDSTTFVAPGTGSYFFAQNLNGINGSAPLDYSDSGVIYGGQIGYLSKFSGWGFGVEADFSRVGATGVDANSWAYVFPPAAIGSSFFWNGAVDRDFLVTIRARMGFDVAGAFVYGTGGIAIGDADISVAGSDDFFPFASPVYANSEKLVGWTLGGGLETMLGGNVSGKVEYLYVDLGSLSAGGTLLGGGFTDVIASSAKVKDHVLRAGLNLHF